ncbi:serine hydrolase [Undibacterium sp. Tian12W]|uniref:serine hydrolase n=1 Tax=Undibacterium sp. Tian12W TaxID=3413054 RepID=UPI003BF14635
MRNIFLLFSLSILLFSAKNAGATLQPDADTQIRLKKFEQFAVSQMTRDNIPGLSIGYLQDKVMWARGYGYADVENKMPATATSSYRLASVTKPMTATAILQLVDSGKVELDAEVQNYVPYFPKKPYPITVRQLLGHLAGINAYVNPQLEQHFKEHKNTRESIAVFENFDLIAEPGTRFRYTSYGYNLLGAVIEGASGMSYGDYMSKNVWAPLGMTATRLDDPYDIIPERVRGYQLQNQQIKHAEFIDISSRFSAGGTRSTVIDMLKFGDGIIHGRIVSKDAQNMMFDSMETNKAKFTNYSAGWLTSPVNGRFSISHDGVQPETSTYLFCFPSRGLTIAVAANLQRIDTSIFAAQLFEAITGEAWDRPLYIHDAEKRVYYDAVKAVFNEGNAYFEHKQKAYADEVKESKILSEAFISFNQQFNQQLRQQISQHLKSEAIRVDAKQTQFFMSEALHSAGGLQLRKIGSYMAKKLHEKNHNLSSYSNSTAITFFHDYIALYKKDSRVSTAFRFDDSFERQVEQLYVAWKKTSHIKFVKQDFDMQEHILTAKNNAGSKAGLVKALASLHHKIKNAYQDAAVAPDYLAELKILAQDLIRSGNANEALKIGQLAQEIYPSSEGAHALAGVLEISSGNKDKGLESLKTALRINAKGDASAVSLNDIAYRLRGTSGPEAGLKILQAAIELHPGDVNLYDSLGEFYATLAMNEKALLAYQKALDINPGHQNAKAAIQQIQTLQKLMTNKN